MAEYKCKRGHWFRGVPIDKLVAVSRAHERECENMSENITDQEGGKKA